MVYVLARQSLSIIIITMMMITVIIIMIMVIVIVVIYINNYHYITKALSCMHYGFHNVIDVNKLIMGCSVLFC